MSPNAGCCTLLIDPALPLPLSDAISHLLQGVSRKELGALLTCLSSTYRGGGTSQEIVCLEGAIAYASVRMPATFGACLAAFDATAKILPELAPKSLLDMGAGTGAASWAAIQMWPGIEAITMVDHNPSLRALAGRLAKAGPRALATARIESGAITSCPLKADLVTASYVLCEIDKERTAEVALALWQACEDALLLVEPGTPEGFARIARARSALRQTGAYFAAPCTHENACPMAGSDWCHFSQRLPRSRAHKVIKGANVPFEDERYSYLVATHRNPLREKGRILSPPMQRKPGIHLKLCTPDGLDLRFVARREKQPYARARRLKWGDAF